METEFDEKVLDYWRLPIDWRNSIVKLKKDDWLDDDCDFKNPLPAVLAAFVLSIIKRIMNNFVREIKGYYQNNIHYTDTDSFQIKKILGCIG